MVPVFRVLHFTTGMPPKLMFIFQLLIRRDKAGEETMRRAWLLGVFCVAIDLATANSAFADLYSKIRGTVSDQSGAVVSGRPIPAGGRLRIRQRVVRPARFAARQPCDGLATSDPDAGRGSQPEPFECGGRRGVRSAAAVGVEGIRR